MVAGSFFTFYFFFSFFFIFPCFIGWGNLSYIFGCDYLSYGLILLRFWICVLMIMARESVLRSFYHPGFFLFFVVLLVIFLFCTFGSVSLFSFYLFFESRLIPTVFIILGWGYQPERLQAGIYLVSLYAASFSSYVGRYFLCL
jgi:NADH-ubiquinone oxidoreductase chain 4